jgi:dipeptidase E
MSERERKAPRFEVGRKLSDVLELTALPGIDNTTWVPVVVETDVLLINDGDPVYLSKWVGESGVRNR